MTDAVEQRKNMKQKNPKIKRKTKQKKTEEPNPSPNSLLPPIQRAPREKPFETPPKTL